MVTSWQMAILTLARTTHETKLQGDDFNIKTQQFSGIINQSMVSFCDKPLTALSASFCKKVRVVRIRWHSKSGCQWPTRLSSSSLSTCKKMWSSTAISVYLVGLGLGWTCTWLDLDLVGCLTNSICATKCASPDSISLSWCVGPAHGKDSWSDLGNKSIPDN